MNSENERDTLFSDLDAPRFLIERRDHTGAQISELRRHSEVKPVTSLQTFWSLVHHCDLGTIRDQHDLTLHFFAAAHSPIWEAFPTGAVAKVFVSDLNATGALDRYWPAACALTLWWAHQSVEHRKGPFTSHESPNSDPSQWKFPCCNVVGVSSGTDVIKFWIQDTMGSGAHGPCAACRWNVSPAYKEFFESELLRQLNYALAVSENAVRLPTLAVAITSTAQLMKRAHRTQSSIVSQRGSGFLGYGLSKRWTSTGSFDFTSRALEADDVRPAHRRMKSEGSGWLTVESSPRFNNSRSESTMVLPRPAVGVVGKKTPPVEGSHPFAPLADVEIALDEIDRRSKLTSWLLQQSTADSLFKEVLFEVAQKLQEPESQPVAAVDSDSCEGNLPAEPNELSGRNVTDEKRKKTRRGKRAGNKVREREALSAAASLFQAQGTGPAMQFTISSQTSLREFPIFKHLLSDWSAFANEELDCD